MNENPPNFAWTLLHTLSPNETAKPTITAEIDIPLQVRKLSCPPNSRGERLPADDRVDNHHDGNCDLDVIPLDQHSPSIAQRVRAFMSRAPLIRSSPALGASSYGAVRIPQEDSEDDVDLAPRRKNAPHGLRRSQRSLRASLESCPEGPSTDGRRQPNPKRSHSSDRRRSGGWYSEGHNRRPSSATSDVGMGADSKFSFATGLAMPGNPVMQDTPASSPCMTSDDEDVLDIEDDDAKSFDEDPPDNSP